MPAGPAVADAEQGGRLALPAVPGGRGARSAAAGPDGQSHDPEQNATSRIPGPPASWSPSARVPGHGIIRIGGQDSACLKW